MKRQLLGVSVFVSLLTLNANAQTIASDSQGKDVFSFHRSGAFSFPISSADKSVKANYNLKLGKGTQYFVKRYYYKNSTGNRSFSENTVDTLTGNSGQYLDTDSLHFTVAKSNAISISANVGNVTSNILDIRKADLTFKLGFGFGENLDVFNSLTNVHTLGPRYSVLGVMRSWHISAYLAGQRVNLYDTLNKKSEKTSLYQKGITAEYTQFYKPRFYFMWGTSLSLTFENGKYGSSLKNYQLNKPGYINGEIISLGDYIGKIGDPKNTSFLRTTISFPMLPGAIEIKRKSKVPDNVQLCIIPYYVCYGKVDDKFTNLIGVYINAAQGQNIFAKNSAIVSGFGIGTDYNLAAGKFMVFAAGSFNISNFVSHKKSHSSPQKAGI